MPPMTDTQYRVLGDLAAGGYILHSESVILRGTYVIVPDGPDWRLRVDQFERLRDSTPQLIACYRREWPQAYYRITDAGRAAYAQAQARRVAQEATG